MSRPSYLSQEAPFDTVTPQTPVRYILPISPNAPDVRSRLREVTRDFFREKITFEQYHRVVYGNFNLTFPYKDE